MNFLRRNKEPARPDGPAVAPKSRGAGRRGRRQETYSMSSRPTFGQWLKATWLDILTMAAMGAIGLGVSDLRKRQ
jgi:diacylglycerol diphosphate phosphatase / phosphatidate phosphatase